VPEPGLAKVIRGRIVARQEHPHFPFKMVVIEDDGGVIEYVDSEGNTRRFCLVDGRVVKCR